MKKYNSKKENSGVIAYENGPEYIKVMFRDHGIYLYDYSRPGKEHVEAMKKLAGAGEGLATYINMNVRSNYSKKLN